MHEVIKYVLSKQLLLCVSAVIGQNAPLVSELFRVNLGVHLALVLQRLLPLETAMDLLQTVVPPTPTPRMMRVRPFMPQDEVSNFDGLSVSVTSAEVVQFRHYGFTSCPFSGGGVRHLQKNVQ